MVIIMIYPQLNGLIKKTGSRYALVIATAKRARQLSAGELPLTNCKSTKPVTIAVHELAEGTVTMVKR
jgi:DNA-directed RNA polymerase subunit omega